MMRPTQKLTLAAIAAAFVLLGTGVGPAPFEVPSAPDLPEASAVGLASQDAGVPGAQAEDPLCLADPARQGEPVLDPVPAARQELMSPCCQTLCDQICGVNQACACKRCVVFGCEL
jgi:hypothetical protein